MQGVSTDRELVGSRRKGWHRGYWHEQNRPLRHKPIDPQSNLVSYGGQPLKFRKCAFRTSLGQPPTDVVCQFILATLPQTLVVGETIEVAERAVDGLCLVQTRRATVDD